MATWAGHNVLTDVLVVGAGPAGLVTAAACLAAGFNVTVLESNTSVGGWAFTVDGGKEVIGPAGANLMSVDGFRAQLPVKPTARDIQQYLASYAAYHTVQDHVRLSCRLIALDFDPAAGSCGRWLATFRNLATAKLYRASADVVVICTGHGLPEHGDMEVADTAGGARVLHAQAATPSDIAPDACDLVTVVGDGNAAVDCASSVALLRQGKGVMLQLQQVPVSNSSMPNATTTPAAAPTWLYGSSLLYDARRRALAASLQPHHTAAPPGALGRALGAPTKRRFWSYVKAKAAAAVVSQGQRSDSAALSHDPVGKKHVVLWAPSFRDPRVMPFLGPALRAALLRSIIGQQGREGSENSASELLLYRDILHPDVPGLAFIGLEAHPRSPLLLLELQAQWLAAHLTSRTRLPPRYHKQQELQRQRAWRAAALASPLMSTHGSLARTHEDRYMQLLLADMQGVVEMRLIPTSSADVAGSGSASGSFSCTNNGRTTAFPTTSWDLASSTRTALQRFTACLIGPPVDQPEPPPPPPPPQLLHQPSTRHSSLRSVASINERFQYPHHQPQTPRGAAVQLSNGCGIANVTKEGQRYTLTVTSPLVAPYIQLKLRRATSSCLQVESPDGTLAFQVDNDPATDCANSAAAAADRYARLSTRISRTSRRRSASACNPSSPLTGNRRVWMQSEIGIPLRSARRSSSGGGTASAAASAMEVSPTGFHGAYGNLNDPVTHGSSSQRILGWPPSSPVDGEVSDGLSARLRYMAKSTGVELSALVDLMTDNEPSPVLYGMPCTNGYNGISRRPRVSGGGGGAGSSCCGRQQAQRDSPMLVTAAGFLLEGETISEIELLVEPGTPSAPALAPAAPAAPAPAAAAAVAANGSKRYLQPQRAAGCGNVAMVKSGPLLREPYVRGTSMKGSLLTATAAVAVAEDEDEKEGTLLQRHMQTPPPPLPQQGPMPAPLELPSAVHDGMYGGRPPAGIIFTSHAHASARTSCPADRRVATVVASYRHPRRSVSYDDAVPAFRNTALIGNPPPAPALASALLALPVRQDPHHQPPVLQRQSYTPTTTGPLPRLASSGLSASRQNGACGMEVLDLDTDDDEDGGDDDGAVPYNSVLSSHIDTLGAVTGSAGAGAGAGAGVDGVNGNGGSDAVDVSSSLTAAPMACLDIAPGFGIAKSHAEAATAATAASSVVSPLPEETQSLNCHVLGGNIAALRPMSTTSPLDCSSGPALPLQLPEKLSTIMERPLAAGAALCDADEADGCSAAPAGSGPSPDRRGSSKRLAPKGLLLLEKLQEGAGEEEEGGKGEELVVGEAKEATQQVISPRMAAGQRLFGRQASTAAAAPADGRASNNGMHVSNVSSKTASAVAAAAAPSSLRWRLRGLPRRSRTSSCIHPRMEEPTLASTLAASPDGTPTPRRNVAAPRMSAPGVGHGADVGRRSLWTRAATSPARASAWSGMPPTKAWNGAAAMWPLPMSATEAAPRPPQLARSRTSALPASPAWSNNNNNHASGSLFGLHASDWSPSSWRAALAKLGPGFEAAAAAGLAAGRAAVGAPGKGYVRRNSSIGSGAFARNAVGGGTTSNDGTTGGDGGGGGSMRRGRNKLRRVVSLAALLGGGSRKATLTGMSSSSGVGKHKQLGLGGLFGEAAEAAQLPYKERLRDAPSLITPGEPFQRIHSPAHVPVVPAMLAGMWQGSSAGVAAVAAEAAAVASPWATMAAAAVAAAAQPSALVAAVDGTAMEAGAASPLVVMGVGGVSQLSQAPSSELSAAVAEQLQQQVQLQQPHPLHVQLQQQGSGYFDMDLMITLGRSPTPLLALSRGQSAAAAAQDSDSAVFDTLSFPRLGVPWELQILADNNNNSNNNSNIMQQQQRATGQQQQQPEQRPAWRVAPIVPIEIEPAVTHGSHTLQATPLPPPPLPYGWSAPLPTIPLGACEAQLGSPGKMWTENTATYESCRALSVVREPSRHLSGSSSIGPAGGLCPPRRPSLGAIHIQDELLNAARWSHAAREQQSRNNMSSSIRSSCSSNLSTSSRRTSSYFAGFNRVSAGGGGGGGGGRVFSSKAASGSSITAEAETLAATLAATQQHGPALAVRRATQERHEQIVSEVSCWLREALARRVAAQDAANSGVVAAAATVTAAANATVAATAAAAGPKSV